eukprot:g6302.t1
MAWRLPMAYGLVPAAAAKDHRKYKAQVAAAVNSAAVYGCDALLIAAKMGLGSLVGRRGTHGCRWSISSAEVWVDFGMENANGSTNRHMSWNVQF